ncbi:nuclear transport factor 2 family protein [Mycolicibacterium sp. BiH015]|uniref:nuclear transport factor 2 family protein n=1 Tax=Mycolicibacterium sp. BiH015 TaxID=3018808 RepID=UPI0022E97DA8|nr:nuclear transport factor 2 family protein [Mycolicibacterium sp. BiH015]MDA2889856.1 nuclear transport factor 2 family protein [Mycolicibacterium sp. BiH015]
MTSAAAVLRLPLIALLMMFLASQATGPAMAQPHDEAESRNLATVQRGFDAWRAGTGSPYDALADDATWEIVGNSAVSRVYTSKEDFLAAVIRPFNSRMSQRLVPTIRDIYADGDTVIVFFDAEGTARDGVPYRNTYSWFLTLREGNIVRASAFFDSIAFNDLWERVPAG